MVWNQTTVPKKRFNIKSVSAPSVMHMRGNYTLLQLVSLDAWVAVSINICSLVLKDRHDCDVLSYENHRRLLII